MDNNKTILTQAKFDVIQEICDPWDVVGGPRSSSPRWEDMFEKTVKAKLPNLQLPVKVGNTGYPVLTSLPHECPRRGWCLDEVGRFLAFIDGYWIFRRYLTGGPLMFNQLTQSCSDILEQGKADEFIQLCLS